MKKQYIILAVLMAIVLAVATHKAMQPNLGLLKFTVKGDRAYGYGFTDDRSVSAVKKLMDEHPQVTTLVLKKMSGTRDADMNMRLARDIRRRGLNTHLERDSFIASGAVSLFLAGNERTMECGAVIGVHTIHYAGDGGWVEGQAMYPGNMGHDPFLPRNEKFLVDMGINPKFYTFTRDAALPHELHHMTTDEIKRFGLLTEEAGCG